MQYKKIKWSVHDNPRRPEEPCIALVTLNRPEHLNAVDPLMRLDHTLNEGALVRLSGSGSDPNLRLC